VSVVAADCGGGGVWPTVEALGLPDHSLVLDT
jgi:hypothetical protein